MYINIIEHDVKGFRSSSNVYTSHVWSVFLHGSSTFYLKKSKIKIKPQFILFPCVY